MISRLRQHQQVVVAFDVVLEILEALAAIVGLAELVGLDHGAHRAVENEDARSEGGVELVEAAGCHRVGGAALAILSTKSLIAKGGILARRRRQTLRPDPAVLPLQPEIKRP